ncbi:MAG: hypothetical protein EBT97_02380 [Actinobacteria bacterium]|nr:hypothetical protein [Actinomycetota bacterium]
MKRAVISVAAVICGLVTFTVPAPTAVAETAGGTSTATRSAMGQIAAGDRTNCTVVNGQVACWGENGRGQIGDGTTTQRTMATYVPGLSGVQSVAVSESNTCVIVTGGGVKCWGDNTYGQLGNGTTNSSSTTSPVDVCGIGSCSTLLSGATQISMGFGFACALLSNTGVACWGYNNRYQTGNGALTMTQVWPSTVTGLTNVASISSGREHTCAVVVGGNLTCWGDNTYGQLGDGTDTSTKVESLVSVNRPGVTPVSAVAATRHATCVITSSDSKVRCWGGDSANELGYETSPNTYSFPFGGGNPTVTVVHTPVTAQLGSTDITAKAIDGGTRAVCVITTSDALACWGSIAGNGISTGGTNFGAAFSSGLVPGMTSTTNVAVSTSTVCATNAGTVKCWGAGPFGELGDNNGTNGSSPTAAVSVLGLVTQTVSFDALDARTTAAAPTTLTATSSSGQTLTYSSSTPSVCSADQVAQAWVLSVVGPGTCTVVASAAAGTVGGGSTYYAPASATRSFAVTAVAPVVTLAAASSVTTSTATLSATVNPALLSTTSAFKYSTKQDMSGATTAGSATTSANAGTVSRTALLTGLSPGTKYYFTFEATNSVGTTTATVQSFTMVGFAPVATTGSATSVSSSRATLNASVTPGGLDTTVWFTWGLKSDLSDGTKVEYRSISDLTATDVSVTVTGLTESTRYYYRVEASNSLGSAKGDIKSFTASRPVGITINNAAEFTNSRKVTVTATGPTGSTQVIISNDGGFGSSETFDLSEGTADIQWTLVASRDERLPKTVYARFVQRFGTQSSTNTDDIILDTTAPSMTGTTATATAPASGAVTVAGARAEATKRGGVRMTVRASDKNSGIGTVQVKTSASGRITDIATSSPKATSRTVRVNTTKKRLWVRVVDRAGNPSKWVTVTVK